jgi:hypothetical protein
MLLTWTKECRLRVFENGLQKRILWPRRDKETGEWRSLHNEKLNDLYSPPTHILMNKSRRKIWWGMQHIWGRGELHTLLWRGNLMEKDHLEDPGIELHLYFIDI